MATNYSVNGSSFEDTFILRSLFSQGGLWTWGQNNFAQLGDNTTTKRSSPIQTIAGGANWKLVAANDYHAAGIKTDGTLWLWGYNAWGQLGRGSTGGSSGSPAQTVSATNDWKSVSMGQAHTLALKTNGTIWAWGYNTPGCLGDGTTTDRNSPVQLVSATSYWKQIAAGRYNSTAIKTDGTLWLWGNNGYGQLGDNTITNKSSPVQTVSGGTNWRLVSAGSYNTAAIKTDGTLWLWGLNTEGQLGTNDITSRSSPVQTVSGGTNWKLVSAGNYQNFAIKNDGTLWGMGRGDIGRGTLGDNTTVSKSSPVQTIAGGTNWKSVSACYDHVLAVKTDRTLWVWGANSQGQLGIDSTAVRSSPVQTISGGTNWKQVSAGRYFSTAITDIF
jgi:alpha-tubulin suppressor-like RCC1 family protein